MRAFLFATFIAGLNLIDQPMPDCFLFVFFSNYSTYKRKNLYTRTSAAHHSYFLKHPQLLPSCFITNWKFVLNALRGADLNAECSAWPSDLAPALTLTLCRASGKSQKSCEICIRLGYKFARRTYRLATISEGSHDKCLTAFCQHSTVNLICVMQALN